MKKLFGVFFALTLVAFLLPGLALDAHAAGELSGTYTEATLAAGEYKLTGDVSLSGSVSVDGEVTIDLNGHKLSGSAVPYFTVESTGKLTILDSGTGGTIDGSTVTQANATTSLLVVKGTLIQRGGDITGYTMCYTGAAARRGVAVGVEDGGLFEMYDGAKITNNKVGSGFTGRGVVGVYKTAVFTMYGGEISDNTTQCGGAISSSGSGFTINIHGGKITGNTSTTGGSAMYLGNGSLNITGGEIFGNRNTGTTSSYFMTVFTDDTDFTMTGGVIGAEAAGSKSTKSIRLIDCDVRISGESQILLPMTFGACTTKLGGLTGNAKILSTGPLSRGSDQTAKETVEDGIYTYTAQPLTYEQGWVELTEELAASGTLDSGIYYLADDVTLPDSVTTSGNVTLYLDGHTLTGTEAPLLTVGSETDTQAVLTISDRTGGFGQIKGITAKKEMLMVYGKLVLEEGVLTGHNNTASTGVDAGAVKINNGATFVMNGGAITNNTAGGRGGAVHLRPGSSFTLNDGEISGNKAALGGGIYCIGSSTNGVVYCTINLYSGVIRNNEATNGNACYLQLADLTMSATSMSEGTVVEGAGSGNTVYANKSKINMSGGSIDAEVDASAGAALCVLGDANVKTEVNFTGTAVVGGMGFKGVSNYTTNITNLRRMGKVTSQKELTKDAEDTSVGVTQTGSVYSYYYDRPVDLRILSIGNSYSRDSLDKLAHLGDVFGLNIDVAYLYEGSSTIRRHALGLANSGFESYSSADGENEAKGAMYTYYRTDPATGDLVSQGGHVNVPYALAQEDWDIVTLQQGGTSVAFPGTYNSDIEFLTDYLKAAEPNAAIYWNMTWSYDSVIKDAVRVKNFKEHFDGDNRVMYNGIVDVIHNNFAQGGTFHDRFAGWLPVGTAVQNMRELGYDHSMNRDGFHLSYKGGRFVASLTVLKTLFPELDLSQLKPEDLTFVEKRSETGYTDLFNVDDDLDMAVQAVNAAVAEALAGRHSKLVITPAPTTVETVTNGASTTVAQTKAPLKPQFPTAAALTDGTVVAAAYENVVVTPNSNPALNAFDKYCFEGVGRIVIWNGDGTDWNSDEPLFVIDQAQLEAWGISHTTGRYALLSADTSADYTIFSDPRDPRLTAVTVDADNDGQADDEMLLLTFWVRDYNKAETVERGTFMVYSLDGGASWQLALADGDKTDIDCRTGGDAAVFADGAILMPCSGQQALYLTWNAETGVWDEVAVRAITVPDTTAVDGSYAVDRIALAAPDGDTVYAFVGGSGVVLKSDDRGETWNTAPVGNQDGLVGQPGLTVIDRDTLYATWTSTEAPCDTYGKIFTLSEGWDSSTADRLYDATGTDTGKNEAGSPTAVKLDDGMLVVSYDTNYRSVVATTVELPEDESADEPMNVEDYKGGQSVTAPTKPGYVFGGWYTDADHTEAHTEATGFAYAKFVNENVLSVMFQLSAGANASSEKVSLRLVSTVDNLNYSKVGFKITFNSKTVDVNSSTVYSKIVANAGGVSFDYDPTHFCDDSAYFITYTLTNIPNSAFGSEIKVVPYWVTMDGTVCEGIENSVTISEHLS